MRRKFQRVDRLVPQSSRLSQNSKESNQQVMNKESTSGLQKQLRVYERKIQNNKNGQRNFNNWLAEKNNALNQFSFNDLENSKKKQIQTFLSKDKKHAWVNDQFSDDSIYQSDCVKTLKDDLMNLQKEEVVELLIEQIQENRLLHIRVKQHNQQWQYSGFVSNRSKHQSEPYFNIQLQCSITKNNQQSSLRIQQNCQASHSQTSDKYAQLMQYMNQYIRNTNQAQHHFFDIIANLKRNNQTLKQANKNLLIDKKQLEIEGARKIQQLQKSILSYVNINNQLTSKYQRLKKKNKTHECQIQKQQQGKMTKNNNQQQEQCLHRQMRREINCNLQWNSRQLFGSCATNTHHQINPFKEILNIPNFISVQGQQKSSKSSVYRSGSLQQKFDSCTHQSTFPIVLKELQGKIKLLQIQNMQIKQRQISSEKMLESKSDKIRQLLNQLQKSSEQKWGYKEQIRQLKSKCFQFQSTCCKIQHYEV